MKELPLSTVIYMYSDTMRHMSDQPTEMAIPDVQLLHPLSNDGQSIVRPTVPPPHIVSRW